MESGILNKNVSDKHETSNIKNDELNDTLNINLSNLENSINNLALNNNKDYFNYLIGFSNLSNMCYFSILQILSHCQKFM